MAMATGGRPAGRIPGFLILPIAVIAAASLYAAFWLWTKSRIDVGIEAWAAVRRAEGYQVSYGAPEWTGFPLGIVLTVPAPAIEAPAAGGGWNWRARSLVARINPFFITEVKVDIVGPQDLRLPSNLGGGAGSVTARSAVVDLAFGGTGRLRLVGLTLDAAEIVGAAVPVRLEHVKASAAWTNGNEADHKATSIAVAIDGRAIDLPPGLRLPFGPRLDDITLKAQVKGRPPAGPIVESLGRWREEGGTVEVETFDVQWSPLRMYASGTLALDEQLQPIGALTARIQGFFEAVDALTREGMVRSRDASMAKVVLGMMAKPSSGGGPSTISVPLTIQERRLFVGPVRLVRLPDVRWSSSHEPAPPGTTTARPQAVPSGDEADPEGK
ncbi:MAG: DUF2125 domain-containing protein [Alphaproteobacteria bacterium]